MAVITNYNDYVDLAEQEYNLTLTETTENNLFTKISESGQRNQLARYYYNKTGFEISDSNHIVIAPKNGFMINRLSYINNDLLGGVKSGIQALDIDTSNEGKVVLRNKGSIGQAGLIYVFHSLAYALGIKIDTSKVDIYPVLNEALRDFEFLYFAPLNIARTITRENINYIYVVFIMYNNRTYFDEVLLQSLANAMYNAGWFSPAYEIYVNEYEVGDTTVYYKADIDFNFMYNIAEKLDVFMNNSPNYPSTLFPRTSDYVGFLLSKVKELGFSNNSYNYVVVDLYCTSGGVINLELSCWNIAYTNITIAKKTNYYDNIYYTFNNATPISLPSECMLFAASYEPKKERLTGTSYTSNRDVTQLAGYRIIDASYAKISTSTAITNRKLQGVDGITYIEDAVLPSGLNSLESDYPFWAQVLEKWTVTAIEHLIDQTSEALRNLFKIISFLPLNIFTNGVTYPEKKPGVPYTPFEVTTYEVLLPDIIPPLPTNIVETLTLIPDEDDVVEDPNDPKTYEPIIDPKHPEKYPPEKPYYNIDIDIDYPKDYNDPIGDNPSNPTEPPSNNHGSISIPPKNPTDSITSSKLFTVYNPTADQIDALGGYLWGESIAGTLASIFTNPLNAIISLHCIYCEPDVIGTKEIRLGYLASGVSAKYVVSQYKEIDCGTIRIPEYYGDCRDYSPYTTINLFLPFIGFRPIKVDDVMGSELSIKYYVDVYTGACLACVSVNKGGVIQLTYNFDGNCSVMLPLTSGSWANMTVGLATALTSMIVNPVAGALQIPNAVHNGISMSSQGQMGSNVGAMGRKKPYVVITNTQAYDAIGYNELYGYPANILTKLSQLEGYTKVKEVHVENVNNATVDEKNEIERLLKSGVIIS